MSKLYELSNMFKQTIFNIEHRKTLSDTIDADAIIKYAERNTENLKVKPIILAVNINHLTGPKIYELRDMFENFKPDIAWIMECWATPINFYGYNKFVDKTIYQNTLYIRSNLLRNRLVTNINYGFRLDNLHFRYIPPKSKSTELFDEEFGDFNFRTNTWINRKDFYMESRQLKEGGMGFKSALQNFFRFIKIRSDHAAIVVQISNEWIKFLRNDYYKLENNIEGLENSNQIGYFYKNSDNYSYPKRNNGKLINPIRENLDLKPWKDLYKHDENKFNLGYKPTISDGHLHKIASRAYDVNNISNRMVLEILYDKPKYLAQKFINALSGEFSSKTVCLTKKNKEPNSVLNLRAIQISPISFKIAEQTRTHLKDWLIKHTDSRAIAFMPGRSVNDVFIEIKKYINWENG